MFLTWNELVMNPTLNTTEPQKSSSSGKLFFVVFFVFGRTGHTHTHKWTKK